MNTNTSRFSSVSQLRISSSTSWHGPSQVVHIKHEHNVGLVGNLVQPTDVVPSRLLFRHVALDRDTANRMSCMAMVDVSHASDESVGSGAIIASLCRGSRGEGWADRTGGGKVKPPTDFSDDLTFLWLETWSRRCEHSIDDELVFSIRVITSFTTRGIESGTTEELEFLQVFIRRKCGETRLRDKWHAIWCALAASAVQAAVAKHADAPPAHYSGN
ncbi:hypothetical protein EDB89DRAFT_2236137 [Lactarius sanguifluus]|nr:hypothetical protein EDB89DRAFT_2236137 [Lactarius sanguifluus]